MINEGVILISSICSGCVQLLCCTVLLYLLAKSLYDQNVKKCTKPIAISIILFFIFATIWSILDIIKNCMTFIDPSIQRSPAIEIIIHIDSFSRTLSVAYFLKLKLQQTYQNTFLAVHKIIINIPFCILLMSICVSIFVVIFMSMTTFNFELMGMSVIQSSAIINIYYLFLLVLLNVKLYTFIKVTTHSNPILATDLNNKLKDNIIKQTNLISMIIITNIIIEMSHFSRFIIGNSNPNIMSMVSAIFSWSTVIAQIIQLSCAYLTFNTVKTDNIYRFWCKYSHYYCICLCQRLIYNTKNTDKYSLISIQNINTPLIADIAHSKYCVFDECKSVERICEILIDCDSNINKQFQANNYLLYDILNDFNHLLMMHDSPKDFENIYNKLNVSNKYHSDYKNCKLYSRHYSR
eukprot:71595_1